MDAVVDRTERADDDHRGLDAGGTGFAEYIASVFSGKHQVDDREVELPLAESGESVLAVAGERAVVAHFREPLVKELPFDVVVFDDQGVHAVIISKNLPILAALQGSRKVRARFV